MSAQSDIAAGMATPENAKRRQILDGARRVFFGQGFDAASMGEIAREAGVSKGTLYVYFDSKEALFAALIEDTKRGAAEGMLALDHEDADVGGTLRGFGLALLGRMSAPGQLELLRMVIAVSDKFPALARTFYEAGPAKGVAMLSAYFEAQTRHGRLAVPDPEIAAWQFLGMCNHPTLTRAALTGEAMPDAARIERVVDAAVHTFVSAYRPAKSR